MLFITRQEELQIDLPLQALYFYAPWMPYHNKMITMIGKIEEKYKDVSFFAIDVGEFESQCKRFSVDSIPTVIILKGGKEVKRINGMVLTKPFKTAFADICTS